jgi:S-adenosylmethionine:tRNA ribosyltransferase-isomerase
LILCWQKACWPEEEGFLLTEDFDYDLPEGRIATHPLPDRDGSRLLILSKDDGGRNHGFFSALPRLLRPRSLLVLNDTRVIPARLHGYKPSGGRVEVFLVERVWGQTPDGETTGSELPRAESCRNGSWTESWQVLIRGLGSCPVGAGLRFDAPFSAEICERGERGKAVLRFAGQGQGGLLGAIEQIGSIPLPPYIEAARRQIAPVPGIDDRVRYQTVYASAPGAVAAPTAGLHFTHALLDRIQADGHEVARITLHVGPGTFRPVATADPTQHQLDAERFEVGEEAAASIRRAQAEGRPIVAVGTTVVRTLETLARRGGIAAGSGSTDLMILHPGDFRLVTDLVTNFHLPKSSLLMLVAAFAGRENVLSAYRDAIERGYRFYSYGDAMFIRPGPLPHA